MQGDKWQSFDQLFKLLMAMAQDFEAAGPTAPQLGLEYAASMVI